MFSRNMKICFLADATMPHTKKFVLYFVEKHYEVHLIVLQTDYEEIPGVNIHILNCNKYTKYLKIFYFKSKIRSIINEIKPDIIHSHYVIKYGFLLALGNYTKTILTAWGSDVLQEISNNLLYRWMAKFTVSRSEYFQYFGGVTRNALISLGAPKDKMFHSHFGVDVKIFSPIPKNNSLKKILNAEEKYIIFSNRNFYDIYDVKTLIKAIPLVIKKQSNVLFILAGRGSELNNLKNLVNTLNLTKFVNFVGYLNQKEMVKYLKIADIFVSTSLTDGGVPISVLEAMSMELPVIFTGHPDTEENGMKVNVNFLQFGFGDFKTLSERILEFLDHKEFGLKMGKNNRELVLKKFNYKIEMEKTEKVYKSIIEDYFIGNQ